MSILSGYKKFKKYIKTSSGFQLQSLWSNANTVDADDGRTMQTKVGAINGISSSETANSSEIAASTALTNKMNGSINNLSRDIDVILQKLSSGFRIELSIGQYVWKPEDESKWHGSGDSARITIEIATDGTATAKVANSGDFRAYGTDYARINKVGIVSVHPL